MKAATVLMVLVSVIALSEGWATASPHTQGCSSAPTLYSLEDRERAFREIRRETLYSVVEVQQGSGSVAEPMFLLQGVCGLMRVRHQTGATVNKSIHTNQWLVHFIDGKSSMHTFPQPDPSKPTHTPSSPVQKVWTLEECQLVGY